eukprot:gene1599-28507_t
MPGRPVDEGGGGESHVAHQMASNFTQLSVELHDAAEAGEVQGISSGLSKGDVNSRDPSLRGRTALHIGCSNSHLEVVRELIRSNADPTLAMDGGWVPAHCAAEAGALSCLREIHRKTPRAVQLADDHGDIPLDVAQTYKREECIKFLEEVEAASLKAFEAGDVEGDP